MPENAGYYEKFNVSRKDGRDGPGGDRERARYFTLDLDHDPYAIPALYAYIEASRDELPLLADDLGRLFTEITGSSLGVVDEVPEPEPTCDDEELEP